MICPNCNTQHGCGCQAKTASDGTAVCTSCIQNYELTKNNKTNNITPTPNNIIGNPPLGSITPIVNSITFNNLNN